MVVYIYILYIYILYACIYEGYFVLNQYVVRTCLLLAKYVPTSAERFALPAPPANGMGQQKYSKHVAKTCRQDV